MSFYRIFRNKYYFKIAIVFSFLFQESCGKKQWFSYIRFLSQETKGRSPSVVNINKSAAIYPRIGTCDEVGIERCWSATCTVNNKGPGKPRKCYKLWTNESLITHDCCLHSITHWNIKQWYFLKYYLNIYFMQDKENCPKWIFKYQNCSPVVPSRQNYNLEWF